MSAADWIQAVTQIVTALTAVVMAYLAYVTYMKPPVQEAEPEKANDAKPVQEGELLVFETSKQKTYLSKLSGGGIHCRIEDARPRKGGPQWTLPKDLCGTILNQGSYRVNPGYKANSGTFTLGPRRNWLYSKHLFPDPSYLNGALKQMLQEAST